MEKQNLIIYMIYDKKNRKSQNQIFTPQNQDKVTKKSIIQKLKEMNNIKYEMKIRRNPHI